MRIGYTVQGSTDRAVLLGLRDRWCPDAKLVEGHFRGTNPRRELPRACEELRAKGCEVIVSLTDADQEDWRRLLQSEEKAVPEGYRERIVLGVADRNIECWLALDREYLASRINCAPDALAAADPKGLFEALIGITRDDKREDEIAAIVKDAPLRNWLRDPSFEQFYERARRVSARLRCELPNERGGSSPA